MSGHLQPPTVRTSFDGMLTGRTPGGDQHATISPADLSPQVHAADQTAVYGAGGDTGPSYKANDIDGRDHPPCLGTV